MMEYGIIKTIEREPPEMAGWNLTLRFGLEVGSLIALGMWGLRLGTGVVGWILAVALPIAAAAVWGVFNVLNDPSRSGEAPIEVAGLVRLVIELAILVAGAMAIGVVGSPRLGIGFGVLIALHYLASASRVKWLLG